MFTLLVAAALAAGPSVPTIVAPHVATSSPVTVRMSSHERGVAAARIRFRCAVDSQRLHACARVVRVRLEDGVHHFYAQAVDPKGHRSKVTWVQINVKLEAPIAASRSFPFNGRALYAAVGEGSIWISNLDGIVSRFDPSSGTVTATTVVGTGRLSGVSYGDDTAWVGSFDTDELVRIDPFTNEIVARIHVGTHPFGTAFTPEGDAWVSNDDGNVYRIDPATNKIRARSEARPSSPRTASATSGARTKTAPSR